MWASLEPGPGCSVLPRIAPPVKVCWEKSGLMFQLISRLILSTSACQWPGPSCCWQAVIAHKYLLSVQWEVRSGPNLSLCVRCDDWWRGGAGRHGKGRVRVRDTNSISPLYICPSRRLDTEVITVWARLGVRQREREREGDHTPGYSSVQYRSPPSSQTYFIFPAASGGWLGPSCGCCCCWWWKLC